MFLFLQFYDHLIDWGLKDQISKLASIRKRYGIDSGSRVEIMAAESELYMAKINDNVIMKIGAKMDLGGLLPSSEYKVATSGESYAVWVKNAT